MSSDIEVFLKYQNQDIRFPEIRTAFLMELEPLVKDAQIIRFNYRKKPTSYSIVELEDVFDHEGYEQESLVPDAYYKEAHYMHGDPGRYVVARLHYFTPTKRIERFLTVNLLITENGLERTC